MIWPLPLDMITGEAGRSNIVYQLKLTSPFESRHGHEQNLTGAVLSSLAFIDDQAFHKIKKSSNTKNQINICCPYWNSIVSNIGDKYVGCRDDHLLACLENWP